MLSKIIKAEISLEELDYENKPSKSYQSKIKKNPMAVHEHFT